jgi:hypothetical protein
VISEAGALILGFYRKVNTVRFCVLMIVAGTVQCVACYGYYCSLLACY